MTTLAATDYQSVMMQTERGDVELRLYEAPGATAGLIMGGGVGGGFDTPAQGLYPRLSEELVAQGISSLRVRYRNPTDLEEAVFDVLAGLLFLGTRGVKRVGLVGHSFGGAVMIAAGVVASELPGAPAVETVVGLSSQSYGTGAVSRLAPRSLLLVHGMSDAVLPSSCSVSIHERAGEPKKLELIPGAGHVLDEAAEQVHTVVRDWLVRALVPAKAG